MEGRSVAKMKRQTALERVINQARREQRSARARACAAVRGHADGVVSMGDALELVDELSRATSRLQTLMGMTVLDSAEVA